MFSYISSYFSLELIIITITITIIIIKTRVIKIFFFLWNHFTRVCPGQTEGQI